MSDKPSILIIMSPFPTTGGNLRMLRALEHYIKQFDVYIFIPGYELAYGYLPIFKSYIERLFKFGIRVAGYSIVPSIIKKFDTFTKTATLSTYIGNTLPWFSRIKISSNIHPNLIVTGEPVECLYLGIRLAEIYNVPCMGFLQLPPFYESKERIRRIINAYLMWRQLIADSCVRGFLLKAEGVARTIALYNISFSIARKLIKKCNYLIAVSRAIPVEMGREWMDKVYALDPGVSLDEEDLILIQNIRRKKRKKNF